MESFLGKENQTFPLWRNLSILLFCMCVSMSSMGQSVKWALVDTKDTYPFHDGIACFHERNVGYGGINRNGKVVISPIYSSSFSFKNGVAIVKLKNKKGIINIEGTNLLELKYKDINEEKEAIGLYSVEDSVGNRGLFFNSRLILPCKYKYLHTYNFPIIDVTEQNDLHYYVNILNGRIYEYCTSQGNLLIVKNKGTTDYYLKGSGEQVNKSSLLRSSKGLKAYYDENTMRYGLKNEQGQIVVQARYYERGTTPVWYQNTMVLRTDTVWDNMAEVMIDASGNEIIRSKVGQNIYVLNDNYVHVSERYVAGKDGRIGLYTTDGKVILPMKYYAVNPIVKDWFVVSSSTLDNPDFKLFNAKSKRFYDGVPISEYSNGMFHLLFKKGDSYFHSYVDMETGYEIPTKYSEATNFSGGLAIVKQGDKAFAIDKRGNVILSENSQFYFSSISDGFSEGVIGAVDKISHTNGYIYNPLGNEGYTYNTMGTASDETIERWMSEGERLFKAGKYVSAKDFYYRVLMSNPSKVEALNDYAVCLDNMGYYDEAIEAYRMALDIYPGYSLAEENLQSSLENKRAREESKKGVTEDNTSKSGTFWDALGSFCSVLGNMMGGSSDYTYENSFSSSSSLDDSPSKRSASSYQSEYNRWEQRAQSNYNSLTNLGYRAKNKSGDRSGGTLQSMSGSNYVQMKKALRDAQREMRNIRQKAQRSGVAITQSSWETATVDY